MNNTFTDNALLTALRNADKLARYYYDDVPARLYGMINFYPDEEKEYILMRLYGEQWCL